MQANNRLLHLCQLLQAIGRLLREERRVRDNPGLSFALDQRRSMPQISDFGGNTYVKTVTPIHKTVHREITPTQ